MEKKKIIDYETLEQPIRDIELVLEEFDQQEKNLILNFVRQRYLEKISKQKIRENLADNKLYKFANKFIDKGDD